MKELIEKAKNTVTIFRYIVLTVIGIALLAFEYWFYHSRETFKGDAMFFIDIVNFVIFGLCALQCFKRTDGLRILTEKWNAITLGVLFSIWSLICIGSVYNDINYFGETVYTCDLMTDNEREDFVQEYAALGLSDGEINTEYNSYIRLIENSDIFTNGVLTALLIWMFISSNPINEVIEEIRNEVKEKFGGF